MKKGALLMLWLFLWGGREALASVIDAPHNEANGISCGSCHTYSLWWKYSPAASAGTDFDLIVNTVCLACHGSNGPAPTVVGHSGAALGSTAYHDGLWEEGCIVCHNPHEQSQIAWSEEHLNPYVVTGTISSVTENTPAAGQTTIFYAGRRDNPELSPWPETAWGDKSAGTTGRGLILVHDQTLAVNTFSVLSATQEQIVIQGTITPGEIDTVSCPQAPACAEANTFGLLYGQFIRQTITTPDSGTRQVKFLDPHGGFTDTENSPPTGLCQVCHTQTHYWDSNGGNATHNQGGNCTTCHPHQDGFKPGFPSHAAVVRSQAQCTACHTAADQVLGTHQGRCDHCHTQPPTLATPLDRQQVIAISQGDCLTCHGDNFSHPQAIHVKVTADPSCAACHDSEEIIADIHQANCLGCHGSSQPLVVNAITSKSGGTCLTCHAGTSVAGLRHGITLPEVASRHDRFEASASCTTCHDIDMVEKRISRHRQCSTCHHSTRPEVVMAIANGAAGSSVTCDSCHGRPHDTDFAHNNRVTRGLALSCVLCHSVNTQAAIDTLHQGCATCHGYTGHTIDPLVVAGVITAGKGETGVETNCEDCHGLNYGHPGATHGKVVTVESCRTCHAGANIITDIHQQDCVGCHTSTRAEVVQAIATRLGGSCTTCHSAAHAPVAIGSLHEVLATRDCAICHYPRLTDSPHDNLTTAANCQNCHPATSFEEIVSIHQNDCLKCHLSGDPAKSGAIAAGKAMPGGLVTCETCHGVNYGHPMAQHRQVRAAAECLVCHIGDSIIAAIHQDNCRHCHQSPRPEVRTAIAGKEGGTCKTCHWAPHRRVPDIGTLHLLGYATCAECHYPNLSAKPHNNLSCEPACSLCHDGTTFTRIVAIHADNCLTCHLSGLEAVSVVITGARSSPETPATCQSCHTGAADAAPNHGTTPATAAGDHALIAASTACADCHLSGSTEQRLALHPACTTCHGSSFAAVRGVIRSGTTVGCESCHTGTTSGAFVHGTSNSSAAGVHDHYLASATCAYCHLTASAEQRLALHPGCTTCHASPLAVVNGVIASGRAGTMVSCESCHSGATSGAFVHGTNNSSAAAVHDQFLASTTCASCHLTGSAAQRLALHPACTTCHGSTKGSVVSTIEAGRAGSAVVCENCHDGSGNGAPSHGTASSARLYGLSAATAACATCHPNGSVEARTSRHQGCTTCHSSSRPALLSASGWAGNQVQGMTCPGGNLWRHQSPWS